VLIVDDNSLDGTGTGWQMTWLCTPLHEVHVLHRAEKTGLGARGL
jgi:hypothetical protein